MRTEVLDLGTAMATAGKLNENLAEAGYGHLLSSYGIVFRVMKPYLIIGEVPVNAPVGLHISIVTDQMTLACERMLPLLKEQYYPFRIPENERYLTMMLDGSLGYERIGKAFTIFLPDDLDAAKALIQVLSPKLDGLIGPDVPGASRIGNCLFITDDHAGYGQQKSKLAKALVPPRSFWLPKKKAVSSGGNWLGKRYFKMATLKKDAKGNVYKALDLGNWMNIRWCLIKEGKKYQCRDRAGRSITDRLQWQYEVQSKISGPVSLPKAIDYFEVDGDAYFVMEYIEGRSFNDKVSEISKGEIWHSMPVQDKRAILILFLKALSVVSALHHAGYVHRDLSPLNFMVTGDDELVAIDIELCYSLAESRPNPAFNLGTAGYLSPEQGASKIPALTDDIFGIGGLLVRIFTGMSPSKFRLENTGSMVERLHFFVQNTKLAELVASCFGLPEGRPALIRIMGETERYLSSFDDPEPDRSHRSKVRPRYPNEELAFRAAMALLYTPFRDQGRSWYGKTRVLGSVIGNEIKGRTWYPDLSAGACGILYALYEARSAGLDLSALEPVMDAQYKACMVTFQGTDQKPGLLRGSAGFMLLHSLAGLPFNKDQIPFAELDHLIRSSLQTNARLDIADGIAGVGFALLKFAHARHEVDLSGPVTQIADALISSQHRDGSWMISNEFSAGREFRPTGFVNGISGILYFLLHYNMQYQHPKAKKAIDNGLEWLLSQPYRIGGDLIWPVSAENKATDPWFEDGFTGIAFLLMHTFKMTGEERFKTTCYQILRQHPELITSNYLSIGSGIAGLAQVYMEAYVIFKDDVWAERAGQIIRLLSNICTDGNSNTVFWLDGSSTLAEPGLMNGHAGILHLLIRYLHPELVKFPVFNL